MTLILCVLAPYNGLASHPEYTLPFWDRFQAGIGSYSGKNVWLNSRDYNNHAHRHTKCLIFPSVLPLEFIFTVNGGTSIMC